ncbi:MAG: asparagine synthase (glutamine-hydrolyzing) [Salinivirgaceae bacterium]|nr:asparagine synthase (glutamine-hydrolyzing) [Salinivirgaceae bacterium]
MCGIAGVYAITDEGRSRFELVEQATGLLSRRGPDTKRSANIGRACLGHARLSVIDLSEAASQPFTDATGRYTIVYNGEIYNYRQLRSGLEAKGYQFKTDSDTEVVLYQYIESGHECLSKFTGFFAFALYDSRDETLFIARDRMGQKPLLYYHGHDYIAFASEMKAIMALGVPRELDMTSLCMYLRFNYIPSPNSIFADVRKLEQGHYLTIKNGHVKDVCYYTIPHVYSYLSAPDYETAQHQLRELIGQSVCERLVSDVPLGAFLSGGIDSSVIVAEAAKHVDNLSTFSIGYADEPFFDETKYAQLVADKFHTNHHVFRLTNNDLYEHLHTVLDYIDEPFADSSAIAVNILSHYTRQHVTVALSGDGADEMFGGYNKHTAHLRAIRNNLGMSMVKMASPLYNLFPQSRNTLFGNRMRQLRRLADGLKLDAKNRYLAWASLMGEHDALALLNNKVLPQQLNKRNLAITSNIRHENNIIDILHADMQLVLVSDMLFKVDMMSMAESLEVRSPFLDHRIVNFAFSLPPEYLINNKMRKRIVQDAYRSQLPPQLYCRPKHGFEVPMLKWFRGELKSVIETDYLQPDFIREQNIFNPDLVQKMLQKLNSKSPGDAVANIWALIVFQHWWKKNML